MENPYLLNPIKIVIIDPIRKNAQKVYVVIGNVPKNIYNAIQSYALNKTDGSKKILQGFYGKNWKDKLYFNEKITGNLIINQNEIDNNNLNMLTGSNFAESTDDISNETAETPEKPVSTAINTVNTPLSTDNNSNVENINNSNVENINNSNVENINNNNVENINNNNVENTKNNNLENINNNNLENINIKNVENSENIANKSDENGLTTVPSGITREIYVRANHEIDDSFGEHESMRGGMYGRGEDIIFTDDDLKKEVRVETELADEVIYNNKTEYITQLSFYSVDKISEVKEKVFLITRIPIYRQHLFYYLNGKTILPYNIHIDTIYNVNIFSDPKSEILNIPFDKYIYDNREDLKIEAFDEFMLLDNKLITSPYIYVVDLSSYMGSIKSNISNLDVNQIYRLYYGFVIKFFPMITREIFQDYINDENIISMKFPEISPPRSNLTRKYNVETNITEQIYKKHLLENQINTKLYPITVSLTHLLISVNAPQYMVNLRNLFDKLQTSKCIPEVIAILEHQKIKYFIRKQFLLNESNIAFPAVFKTGLTIAISLKKSDQISFHDRKTPMKIDDEQSRYIYINIQSNGKYFIKSLWNEEEEYTFNDVLKIIKYFTDDVIDGINKMGRLVFPNGGQLTPVNKYNVVYENMNINIFWKKNITEENWKLLKELWKPFIQANIIDYRFTNQGTYEFVFKKGITHYNIASIEKNILASTGNYLSNYYLHLINPVFKTKWQHKFGGRISRMIQRTTDIKFEVINIHENEFEIYYRYILVFLSYCICQESIMKSSKKIIPSSRKLRKLKEMDPDLFNLKRYGDSKPYSRICQKKFQPYIYIDEELKNMSATEKSKVVKYWNFTMNKPAYYGCPNAKYPHLSFIVGNHPKSYCLPCCEKISHSEESSKNLVNKQCLKSYVYKQLENSIKSKHIVSYTKIIENGRYSTIPDNVSQLLFNCLEKDEMYVIYGIPQSFRMISKIGVLNTLVNVLGKSLEEVINIIIGYLKKNPEIFNSLLNGNLMNYFKSNSYFINYLSQTFINQSSLEYIKFKNWNNLFIEISLYVFNIICFVFNDNTGTGEVVDLFIINNILNYLKSTTDKKFLLIMKKMNYYYPVYIIDKNTLEDRYKLLNADTKTVQVLNSVVLNTINKPELNKINKNINLKLLREIQEANSTFKITKKYVNMHNICYAVLINDVAYIPVEGETNISDNIDIDFNIHMRADYKYADLEPIIKQINSYILAHYVLREKNNINNNITIYALIKPIEYIIYNDAAIGFISGNINLTGNVSEFNEFNKDNTISNILTFWVNIKEINDNIPKKIISYDPEIVNSLILKNVKPKPDMRSQNIGNSLYSIYKYQLLLLEFINYLKRERNQSVRNKLRHFIDDIKLTDSFIEIVQKLNKICSDDSDISNIGNNIFNYYYEHNDNTIYRR